MKYEIKILIGRLDKKSAYLNMDLTPKNELLSACFSQVSEKNYPNFINRIINNETYGEEFIGVYCYGDIDEEDFFRFKEEIRELKNNEIFIEHDITGSCIVSRYNFIEIMYQYSLLLLFYNRNNASLGLGWQNNMVKELKKTKLLLNGISH